MKRDEILNMIQMVVREETSNHSLLIDEQTKAEDVPGWDSLAHTRIILGIENVTGKNIPIEETYYATNIAELITLII